MVMLRGGTSRWKASSRDPQQDVSAGVHKGIAYAVALRSRRTSLTDKIQATIEQIDAPFIRRSNDLDVVIRPAVPWMASPWREDVYDAHEL